MDCPEPNPNDDPDAGAFDLVGPFKLDPVIIKPDPARLGRHVVNLDVKDARESPVRGALVTIDPEMPSMGHGSSEQAVVSELGRGAYQACPVTLQMPGPWVVTIKAARGGASGVRVVSYVVQ